MSAGSKTGSAVPGSSPTAGPLASLSISTIALFGFAAAVGALVPIAGLAVIAAIPVVVGGMAALSWPPLSIWLMEALIFFGNRTELERLTVLGRWLPTIGILLLPLALLLNPRKSRWSHEDYLKLRPFVALVSGTVFALGALVVVSGIVNDTAPRDVITGLLVYLRYPMFFLCLIWANFSHETYRRVLAALVGLTVLQIPITAIQYSVFGLSSDSLKGTMGANEPLATVILAAASLVIARLLVAGITTRRLLLAVGLFLPLVFGDIQGPMLAFPLLALYLALRHRAATRARALASRSGFRLLAGVLGSLLVVTVAVFLLSPDAFTRFQTLLQIPDLLSEEHISTASVGRISVIPFMFRSLLDQPGHLLIGFGPESTYGGLLGGDAGKACAFFMAQGLTECRTTQFFRTLGEFGILGMAVTWFLIGQVWMLAWTKPAAPSDPSAGSLILGFDGMAFLFAIFFPLYVDSFRVDVYSFVFWIWAAAVLAERLRQPAGKAT